MSEQGVSSGEVSDEIEPTIGQRIWEQVVTFAMAIAIAIGIRACVIEPFRIPSGSMLPTLLIGDHLFVNKFVYGVKVPFSDARLPGLREPQRGDVVVFSVARDGGDIVPADKRPDLPRDDFVKRIVGLPGDRIDISDSEIRVNGERVGVTSLEQRFVDERQRELEVSVEHLNGCDHAILDNPVAHGLFPDQGLVVPEGRYFMMGDNRDHSRDSRDWGTVRMEEFKGPAFILYWSWDRNGDFRDFLNPVNWFTTEKRWDRMFSSVQCGVDTKALPRDASGTHG